MSDCFKKLKRLEFTVTWACMGNCIHCSQGSHKEKGEYLDEIKAKEVIRNVSDNYNIKSVMTFGGEPLLHPDIVCSIHSTAKEVNISKRQLITNGFFSADEKRIKEVATQLIESGVNDILVSVDAFHQETIPLKPVMFFVKELQNLKTKVRTQPAWLVNKDHDNPYNMKTKEILRMFEAEGIEENEGNNVLPYGNARKNLSEYFDLTKDYKSPYAVDPYDIDTISVDPNGDMLEGNIYEQDVLMIMDNYQKSLLKN